MLLLVLHKKKVK